MPGHPIHGIFKDSDALHRLLCPKCKYLLNDPVQPSCGHRICRSCADEIIAEQASPPCPYEGCREFFDEEDGAYVS